MLCCFTHQSANYLLFNYGITRLNCIEILLYMKSQTSKNYKLNSLFGVLQSRKTIYSSDGRVVRGSASGTVDSHGASLVLPLQGQMCSSVGWEDTTFNEEIRVIWAIRKRC